MKKESPGTLFAAAVGSVVLLAGFALIRSSAEQRTMAQQTEVRETGVELSRGIARRLERLSDSVLAIRSDVEHARSAADFSSLLSGFKRDLSPGEVQLALVRYPFNGKGFSLDGDPELSALDWDVNQAIARRPPKPELAGPFRKASGEWLALLRAPVWLTHGESVPETSGWVVASFPLEALLSEAGIDQAASAEIGVQFAYFSPGNPRLRTMSRSAEPDLAAPVRQVIGLTQDRWFLLLAPKQGWTPWPAIALHGVLVLVFALFSAGVAYDFTRRPAELRAEIETRDKRLRAVNERLGEEIHQREDLEKQFRHASFHDPFTGLPNRSYFMDRLGRALRRARLEPGYVMAVIILNLDRFKSINETLGVAAGDQLLTQSVQRLENSLRPEDLVVARLADDEVAVLLFDIGTAQAAAAAAKRLESVLAEPFSIEGQNIFASASMGIALSSSGYEEAEGLVRAAHMALSKAKAGGREKYAIFDPTTREQLVSRHQLESDLHQAIERNEFCLHLQPIVSFQTRRIVGMESLVRWRHPLEGLIPPGSFIPLAEETGLIVPITRWVLREACLIAQTWSSQLPRDIDFYLSVNLSAQDLRQPDVCDYVGEVLRETGIPGGVLRLEVTESMMIGNLGTVSEIVSRFREMNIPLLLDDFGTGYSSLSYLNRFQFDYIKIDRAFVSRIATARQSSGIVKAIVHLAQDLGSRTIAEGVETIEVAEQLQNLGCDFGQGYFFSKALEVDDAHRLLLSRPKWDHSAALVQGE